MEATILRRLYYEMLRIRMVEEKIAELYNCDAGGRRGVACFEDSSQARGAP
jgi:hypothetical protein